MGIEIGGKVDIGLQPARLGCIALRHGIARITPFRPGFEWFGRRGVRNDGKVILFNRRNWRKDVWTSSSTLGMSVGVSSVIRVSSCSSSFTITFTVSSFSSFPAPYRLYLLIHPLPTSLSSTSSPPGALMHASPPIPSCPSVCTFGVPVTMQV